MASTTTRILTAACACGGVEIATTGAPITGVVCYCEDCQAGSRQVEALAGAPPAADPDGGSAYILFRKDRVATSKGAALLKDYKLREKSATNRVVATCCNSAMFLGFDDSRFWVSMYRARFRGEIPPSRMRVCTRSRSAGTRIPDDVPAYRGFPIRFLATIFAAWLPMLLRR